MVADAENDRRRRDPDDGIQRIAPTAMMKAETEPTIGHGLGSRGGSRDA